MLLTVCSFAQHNGHTGKVVGNISSGEERLPFVSIYVKGTTIGTTSDQEGNYELNVPEGAQTIVVSYIGYSTQEQAVSVGHRAVTLNFDLDEDVFGLDQVVISATKNEINRREAPVLVTVTNAKTLEKVKAATLIDGLNFQPGLRTETKCQNCGFSQIRINGLGGAYSQILVNSRPVFGSLNGIYGLEQIPANMIKQIEVTRGGGSAIFGANAIAGTINIITKDPFENQFEVSSKVGFINGEETDAQLNFNTTFVSDDINKGITFFGMYRDRNGYDHNDDGFTEIPDLKNLNFGFKSFYRINDRKKFTAEFNTSSEFRRGGDNIDQSPLQAFIAEQIDTKIVGGGLTYDLFTPNYYNKFSFYGNAQGTRSDNYYGAEMDPLGFGLTKDFTLVSGMQHTAKFDEFVGGAMELTSGVEYRLSDISEVRENPLVAPVDQDVTTFGIFTQVDWKITEKLKFLTGVRGEFFESNLQENNLFILNPRASLLYNITDCWSFRTGYAQGFRAPQFFSEDVHSEIITGEVRDIKLADNLKEERSHSFIGSLEYMYQQDARQLVLTFEGFYTRINDPFVYEDRDVDANGLAFKEKINGDAVTVNGINIEAKYSPNATLSFQLGATLQNSYFSEFYEPEDGISTNEILRTPQVYGNGLISYSPNAFWDFNLTGVYTGRMFVPHLEGFISQTVLEETPGLFDIGINAARTFKVGSDFQMQIQGGVKNIFNSYQDDFDMTLDRDPNYIYGPQLPTTVFFGIKFGNGLF
ncbi:MAG: TonB-dependent receptor [Flavobacteriaceae bacterium]|nr:TonB-dependent receptor [Flavobacteriaceae bacterium]